MKHSLETCFQCGHILEPLPLNEPVEFSCAGCGAHYHMAVYGEALREQFPQETPEPAVSGTDAVCFYHQDNIAAASCNQCGRFVCRVCAMKCRGRMYCPVCLRRATYTGDDPTLRFEYIRQDRLALAIAFLPLGISWLALFALFEDAGLALGMFFGIFFTTSFLTVPLALFLVIRYWKKAEAPLGRPRRRLALALALAGFQLVLWVGTLAATAFALLMGEVNFS